MDKNDGGPAFPGQHQSHTCDSSLGMTLRDYIAAKAMAALVISGDEGAGDRLEELPKYAYLIADAMLEARKGGAK